MCLVPLDLLFLQWSPGCVSSSESVCGPFQKMSLFPVAFHLTQMVRITTDFYSQICRDSSSRCWNPGLRSPGVDLGPLTPPGFLCSRDISLNAQLPHADARPAWFASLFLLPVLWWPFLYLFSYRTSIQLVFRWFSRLIVLLLSCNFNVVMVEGKHDIYLLCHLAQKPKILNVFIFWPRYSTSKKFLNYQEMYKICWHRVFVTESLLITKIWKKNWNVTIGGW